MRVAGDQRFVVRKRYSWKIFEQVVTVAYLKKKIKFHLKPTVLKSLFNNVECLRALTASSPITIFKKNFIVGIWHVSKYVSEPQT